LRNQVFWVVVLCDWVIPTRRFDETLSKLRGSNYPTARRKNPEYLLPQHENRFADNKIHHSPFQSLLREVSGMTCYLSLAVVVTLCGDHTSGYSTHRVPRRTGTEFKYKLLRNNIAFFMHASLTYTLQTARYGWKYYACLAC
jgi:hypothetical protein